MAADEAIEAGGLLSDRMSYTEFFKSRADLTKAFCETAKSYIQISSAALALPIVFSQAMLGKEATESGLQAVGVPCTLVLAIGFGLAYQWLAIRRMWDKLHRDHLTKENAAEWGFRITPWVPQFSRLNRSLL